MEKQKTYWITVLDESGSMSGIADETIGVFNSNIETVKQFKDQDVSVGLVTFSNLAKVKFFNTDVEKLQPINRSLYKPGGMTALRDGVKQAIDLLKSVDDYNNPNVSFLVQVITDGYENSSECPSEALNSLIKALQKTDRWTFVYKVPDTNSRAYLINDGIPDDNIAIWKATKEGVKESGFQDKVALNSYFNSRSRGVSSVASFYVNTDLSDLTSKEVKKTLDDLSHRFKSYNVDKECDVKTFVEDKTKNTYTLGCSYYQLTKSERIQVSKNILIMEKGKKAVWGGQEARDLIGLPSGAEAKVVPGNHANYDIFVQSMSVNRKLVRGTKVLVER